MLLKLRWLIIVALHFLINNVSTLRGVDEDMFAQQRSGKARKHYIPVLPTYKERKPNIILILTDDQDVELGSLNYMPRTLRLIRDEGAEFRHAYTTTPMCCPSRSSLLTGLYMHNHHVYTNNDNCSSTQWQTTYETRSFATYLSNAGYRTGYFGKYLNKYNGSYIPPGWREWGGLIMNSRYYNYSVNLNGKRIRHGDNYQKDYYPDLIANDSVTFLRQSKKYFSRKPVLLVLSFPAPHGPEDSAPQYSNMFFNVTSHHTPSYDYAPNPDKQWILQVTGRMQPIHKQFTDLLMTKRLQTLQSVDDAVEKIYNELDLLGELDNTYIIYTSDHGYHLGQFGLVKGKSFPFEFDIRVPFLVRGPGIDPGTIVDELVLNIDLAPTFLDIAGVDPPPHMDGRSIMKLLNRRRRSSNGGRKNNIANKWPDTFLVESSGRRETAEALAEAALRESIVKVEKDLNQTISANNDMQLDNRLLPSMIGSKSERLALECRKPEYQAPCKPGQKWQCIADGNRWRKHKCKLRSKPANTKKCVCFTPAGLMYTKLEPFTDEQQLDKQFYTRGQINKDIRAYRMKVQKQMRSKRSVLNEEFRKFELIDNESDLEKWINILNNMELLSEDSTKRDKRSAIRGETSLDSQVTAMMGVIEDKLIGLQVSDNETDGLIGSEWNCTVSQSGDLTCSDSLYKNPRTWQQSQHKIADQIRKLKLQLEKLKEIRKYLRDKRPPHVPFDKSNEEDEIDMIGKNNKEIEDTVTDEELEGDNRNEEESETEDDDEEVAEEEDLGSPYLFNRNTSIENEKSSTGTSNISIHNFNHVNKETNNNSDNYNVTKEINLDSIKVNLHRSNEHNVDNNSFVKHRHNHLNHHHHRHHDLLSTTIKSVHVSGNINNNNNNNNNDNPVPNSRHQTNKHKESMSAHSTVPGRIDVTILEPVLSQTTHRNRQSQSFYSDTCYCESDNITQLKDDKELAREARRRIKEAKLRKRERKLRRKAKHENLCLSERMNCFNHDNEHWRTPPYWTGGPFCFCMNANNNTYSCLRTINATHNFLYCEFVTGLVTFYNLRIDPFEQWNRVNSLTAEERSYLHDTLEHLKGCRGVRDCTAGQPYVTNSVTNYNTRSQNKRKYLFLYSDNGENSHMNTRREGVNSFNSRLRSRGVST
ncbi:extracellular sulfatase Sulf1 [Lycorma delicatula]|uniref:extracellular sulfatase Sulf1 n=1 Tax=Lycorma delicatula TaxID=130591 RepID=UPI003F50D841